MRVADLDKIDPGFERALWRSAPAVAAVAVFYVVRGYDVLIAGMSRLRPDTAETGEYSDNGDLAVMHRVSGEIRRVEVERRGLDFTCAADFKHATVSFEPASKMRRSVADIYVVTNERMTHAAFILKSSQPHWFPVTYEVPAQGRERTYMHVPLEYVTFKRIA